MFPFWVDHQALSVSRDWNPAIRQKHKFLNYIPAGLLYFTYIFWMANNASSSKILLLSKYLRNISFLAFSLSWQQSGPPSRSTNKSLQTFSIVIFSGSRPFDLVEVSKSPRKLICTNFPFLRWPISHRLVSESVSYHRLDCHQPRIQGILPPMSANMALHASAGHMRPWILGYLVW